MDNFIYKESCLELYTDIQSFLLKISICDWMSFAIWHW